MKKNLGPENPVNRGEKMETKVMTDARPGNLELDLRESLEMTHTQFKAARRALGLTTEQLAYVLDTVKRSIRAIEADPGTSQSRRPAPRMVRLLEAYLSGYRPPDWPA